MDTITTRIAGFAAGLTYADLPEDVRDAAAQRLVDSLGCALGARDAEISAIARRVAPALPAGTGGGRVIGEAAGATTPDAAAFANTTMLRYLDFNDWYPGGHPSDCIGALLALAEGAGAGGERLLAAMTVAYEVAIGITVASGVRVKGWDQGLALGIGVAAGAGNLLGLPAEQIGHAVAIMTASSVPLRVTRSGQLSLWKGAATAYAGRNGVFAALLAAEGMSGPSAPFEERNGLFDLVTGPFDLPLPPEADWYVPRTSLKYWPVCFHLQAAVWAGRAVRERLGERQPRRLVVSTYATAWKDTGSEPAKWDPTSRETADHSLPYVLARSLRAGAIGPVDFEPEAVLDPTLRPEMARIEVRLDDEVEAAFPGDTIMRVAVTDDAGERHDVEVANPKGHWKNPITPDDVGRKFTSLASPVIGDRRAALALEFWSHVAGQRDLAPGLDLLRVEP